jgi:hypothetical protein
VRQIALGGGSFLREKKHFAVRAANMSAIARKKNATVLEQ